jgi:cysteine sulfinate desulfinase/cysteine desulfurase-like protein
MLEGDGRGRQPVVGPCRGAGGEGDPERAREQVAGLVGCAGAELVFTSGATEAAALALTGAGARNLAEVEHPCVLAWTDPVPAGGRVRAGGRG